MKIAIFTDSFLPGVGGTEQAVLGLANNFKKENKVIVACPKYKNYKDNFAFPVIRARSIGLSQNDYMALLKFSRKFKKGLNNFKADIIHCQTVSGMTSAGLRFAKKHNIPVCVTVHTKFKTAFARSVKSKFIVNLMIKNLVSKLNKCDKVFTVSNDMINELRSYGYLGEITVVRNGTNFEIPQNIEENKDLAKKTFNLPSNTNIFLFVCRIVKFKNLQLILDALKLVKEKNSNFVMLFVGDGPDKKYFEEQTHKLHLDSNVIFTGKIDSNLLKSVYANADVFLFPSVFDNDPLVVVEASIYQVPSIVIENTGSSERIEDNVSGFTTKLDAKCFADKILECMDNKEKVKKVGQNSAKMLPKTWTETANEYLKYYQELIDAKKQKD